MKPEPIVIYCLKIVLKETQLHPDSSTLTKMIFNSFRRENKLKNSEKVNINLLR